MPVERHNCCNNFFGNRVVIFHSGPEYKSGDYVTSCILQQIYGTECFSLVAFKSVIEEVAFLQDQVNLIVPAPLSQEVEENSSIVFPRFSHTFFKISRLPKNDVCKHTTVILPLDFQPNYTVHCPRDWKFCANLSFLR